MPRWTPEARAKQAALIHSWKPWTVSTGPRTLAGKAKVARNADKGLAAKRREGRRLYAVAKYCLRLYDLCQCEERDWKRAVKTGRYDLFSLKHDALPPTIVGSSFPGPRVPGSEAMFRELHPLEPLPSRAVI